MQSYVLLMNYDEHVECWNVWFCFHCMLNNYASLYVFPSQHFISLICVYNFMGLVAWMVSGTVASSSPVEGSGTLQIEKEVCCEF